MEKTVKIKSPAVETGLIYKWVSKYGINPYYNIKKYFSD